jgi:NADH:ubiquinone oxidoreductase subunit 5 (subunit L)/multisubunit Na+/H+ antiporter MnhA subunit
VLAVAIGPLLSDPEGRLERRAQQVDAEETARAARAEGDANGESATRPAPDEYVLYDTYATGLEVVPALAGIVPALLGIVLAWMCWGQESVVPARVAERCGALARMGRNRFYVDEAASLLVSLPLRATAHLARFADWFAVDGVFARLPAWLVRRTGRAGDALRLGIVQYQALGMLLAAALLLVLLSRFGGRR